MNLGNRPRTTATSLAAALALLLGIAAAQEPPFPPEGFEPPPGAPPLPRGDRGFMGGPMAAEQKLVERFDADGNGRLDAAERKEARRFIESERPGGGNRAPGGGNRRPGGGARRGPPGFRAERPNPSAGRKLTPADAENFPGAPLYDTGVLRTLFLDFDGPDWEAELAAFYKTDVEVTARLTVDGKTYTDVGVSFRGASSYFMVPAGAKRSLNISMDLADRAQRLGGVRTLNLLNAHEDPSFLNTVLYSMIAREYIPAPRANLVRVVINGECWGLYVNAEQFNRDFLAAWYPSADGARWKVKGSPGGGGGLDDLGDDVEAWRRRYQIRSKDEPESWKALRTLSRTLCRTPIEKLEAALAPILDIESALWFLALDVTLINNDGYWVRASDYNLFRDTKGVFHIIPHDMNESFAGAMGGPGMGRFPGGPRPGGRGEERGAPPDMAASRPDRGAGPPGEGQPGDRRGRRGGSPFALDPLVGLDDPRKPLRSRLLEVPSLRVRYLEHVRTLASKWLDWKTLGPRVAELSALIRRDVELDTRRLSTFEEFEAAVSDVVVTGAAATPGRHPSLRTFADARRAFLLAWREGATPAGGGADEPARNSGRKDAKEGR